MTCLILTRNRPRWLPYAIQCARYQTYPKTEILIVACGEDARDAAEGARYLHLDGKPRIGAKRNIGCEHARGEIIAHFDDDDFSAPGRLADQIERMRQTGKPVTGYHSMRFTDGREWWDYHGAPNYAIGTSLCYRREFWQAHRFQDIQVGEDNSFVYAAWKAGALISVDAGDLMWATIHPGNTSPRATQAWK